MKKPPAGDQWTGSTGCAKSIIARPAKPVTIALNATVSRTHGAET